MTVSTTDSVIEYTGNASTTTFPVPFVFLADADLVVTLTAPDSSTTTTLVRGSDYTVIGAGAQAGGAIITTTAPTAGATVAISRELEAVQETDLRNQGRFLAETHEKVFDRLTMLIQQLVSTIGRSLTRPIGAKYFDARDLQIKNLADPSDGQDAVNKSWVTGYIDSLEGYGGSASGISYDGGNLYGYLRDSVVRRVPLLSGLRMLDSTRNRAAFVVDHTQVGRGGGGLWQVDASDTISADNNATVVVATDGARWKLKIDGTMDLTQWGVVFDGSDQSDKIQSALDWAQAYTSGEGVNACLTSPVAMPLVVGKPLLVSRPVKLRLPCFINYTGQTGAALIIGSVVPTDSNDHYDIEIEGIRATTFGNTGAPVGYDLTKNHGIEIRCLQFSRIAVKTIIAFTGAGVFLNASNNVYSYQHIQDVDFEFGIIAYCGVGIIAKSVSAETGAVQVNRFKIQNMVTNSSHILLGNPDGSDYNTNDNVFDILALEGVTRGDNVGVEVFGLYNKLNISYSGCGIAFEGPADANRVEAGNPGVLISDYTVPTQNNQFRCGHPNPGNLPASPSTTIGVAQVNNYGVPVVVNVTVSLTPTTASDATAVMYTGKSAGALSESGRVSSSAQATPHAIQMQLTTIVQPGGAWQISKSGGGSVSVISAHVASFGI